MKSFFLSKPMLFANHGGVPGMPACSVPAFDRAAELGAHVIVAHVRRTADGKIVVTAHEDLEIETDLSGKISQHTMEELRRADAAYGFDPGKDGSFPWRGRGISFLTLEELLDRYPGQLFNIELMDKSPDLAGEFCRIAEETGSVERILAGSPHGVNMKVILDTLPGMATAFTPLGIVGFYALFRSGLLFFRKKFRHQALQIPEAIGPSYMANRPLIREAKKRNIHIYIWNAGSVEEVHRLLRFGVSGFIADDLEKIIPLVEEAKKRGIEDEE